MNSAHTCAMTSILIAAGSVLGFVETVALPHLVPVPGLKLGLANIAVVIALALIGRREALIVAVSRVFIVGLATGLVAGPTIWMALAGSVAAWGAMSILFAYGDRFSVVGWSIGGAAAHVLAQLVVASFVVGSATPMMLAPVSLATSIVTGLAVGIFAHLLLSRLPSASYASVAC